MKAGRRHNNFGFSSVYDQEHRRTLYRFECVKCSAQIDLTWMAANLNPEAITKLATAKGWQADAWDQKVAVCPECLARRRKAPDINRELKKVPCMPASPPATVTVLPSAPESRAPTPDERLRIRTLLDKHFDDGPGCYLDGMTDARVAEMASVPRIMVERIREAAYGPIRVSPEMAALRAEVAAMKEDLAAARESVAAQARAVDALTAKISGLSSKLERTLGGAVP